MKKILFIMVLMLVMTACSSGGGEELESANKPGSSEGKTVVTLAARQPSIFLQTAEKKFEDKYPDIDIQIQVTEEYEKYTKTTNAALLSGKGPDIFDISSLPIEDYVSKKLILNMDELMEKDKTINKSDLQMNILDQLKSNDGMYTMPFGFSLRAFIGDGDILGNTDIDDKNWTWKEFEKTVKVLGEKGPERRYAMANDPPEMLLQEMLMDKYSEFVDHAAKEAKFDSPLFMEAMQQIKGMFDNKVMTAEQADIGKQMFHSIVIESPADFINAPLLYFSNPKLLQKPEQKGGTRIITYSRFAIQAQSPVKEEAWKFISFLLSVEGQSLQDRVGFSLLKSVNEKQLNEIQQQVKGGTYKLPDGKVPQVTDEQFNQFKELTSTADNYSDVDGKVFSIVGDEASSFFSEQKSAEEVAKLIQNKVTTYLNE
ncbi:ABC transporter substrate-binding protein [Paenibacillus sp. 2TAB26]|uniref:ABC transporter substrate-binding protein n=1 Tax=Paenibacillus sp. 2TAB26 TaxID=3233005 RepID=UPI003F96D894